MIRLILLAIGVFLAWVLFVSNFSKRQKIAICVAALLISIAGLWYEQAGQTPSADLIAPSELEDCGVSAVHSYRTNYDIEFCLRNTSKTATVKRVAIRFVALQCPDGQCEEIQSVVKEIPVSLAPELSSTYKENLNFDKVDRTVESIVWLAEVALVKGVK